MQPAIIIENLQIHKFMLTTHSTTQFLSRFIILLTVVVATIIDTILFSAIEKHEWINMTETILI